jgi:hypothetical protein
MTTHLTSIKAMAPLTAIALSLLLVACQPEGFVPLSSVPTATLPDSPLPPPTDTGGPTPTPYPTPRPEDITPSPTPTPTVTPEGAPVIITDPEGNFRLQLLPGWRASVGRITVITNYDTEQLSDVHSYPSDGLKIQIGIGRLPADKSFEQWQEEWIALETSPVPEDGWPGQTATDPIPYMLGPYEGFSYYLNGEIRVFEIHLLLSGSRVMGIQLMPADSPALEEALVMLSTLEISPEPFP